MLNELKELVESPDSIFESFKYDVMFDYFDIFFITKKKDKDDNPLVVKTRIYFEEIRTVQDLANDIYNKTTQEFMKELGS